MTLSMTAKQETTTRKKVTRRRRKKKTTNRTTTQEVAAAATQVDVAEVAPLAGASKDATGIPAPNQRSKRRTTHRNKVTGGGAPTARIGTAPTKETDKPVASTEPASSPTATAPATHTVKRSARRGKRRRKTSAHGSGAEAQAATVATVPVAVSTAAEPDADQAKARRAAPKPSGPREEISLLTAAGTREMLINVSGGDECRIAILHEGSLEELFMERAGTQSHVGNIYKGRITNTEPSIQAAFVDFGLRQNGFLHISDVQPQYFPDHTGGGEDVGRKIPRHSRPPIQKCFRRGEQVIVQVTKEGVGTKGPTLTTYLSIPGRYLVMMPGMSRHGVSRKIEDDSDRQTMRDLLKELKLPSDMGFIMRTAGLGHSKRDLQRDLSYLQRLWKTVAERIKGLPAPAELYQESDLVIRTIRDIFTSDFARIVVDDETTQRKAQEFIRLAMPRSKTPVHLYTDPEPLFHRFGIEEEIDKINMRHVPLRSGGSLVIDTTEALVAIDVNSGRFRAMDNAEETAFRINMEAVPEIARQLRLRDLGGLIVCDFIDMRLDHHKREVERALREELKEHKERARILRMSAFGIIEMTRQRQGPSIKSSIYYDCPHCQGAGLVKMPDSVILDVVRMVQLAAHREEIHKITVSVSNDVAFQLLNSRRLTLTAIEERTGKTIVVRGEASFTSDQVEYACEDNRGRPVNVLPRYSRGKE